MTQEQLDKLLASGRQVVTFSAGILTAMGFNAVVSPQDLGTDVDHMINGAKEFWVGAGPLMGAAMLAWSRYKASRASKIASLTVTPGTMVVHSAPEDAAVVANKMAAMPEVHTVVSTPEVATTAASTKVVSL